MMGLLPLALRACVDPTAQSVLGDAVLESGWADERVTWMLRKSRWGWDTDWASLAARSKVRSQTRARNLSRKRARRPTRRWCRAVAAALLFGDWSQERWPGIRQSTERWWGTVENTASILRRLYSSENIAEALYAPTPFYGINREPDPTRLAGVTLQTFDREDLVKLYKPQDLYGLPPPRPRGQLLEAASRMGIKTEAQPNGALVELWEREVLGMAKAARRRSGR